MSNKNSPTLPASRQECRERGWNEIDIILVSGDAYIDHPSFGIALIGRLLEHEGYRVAMLPQPRFDSEADFRQFGRPRLFFGISGGNLDSIVANYSGNGKLRDFDAYSPSGNPWRSSEQRRDTRYRPDRAVLIYANLARQAFPGVTVILGGIEASLRRFVHFDYKQNRLRGSHLSDSKADLLIYGMGERTVLEAATRIERGRPLNGIPGSCVRINDQELEDLRQQAAFGEKSIVELPSWSAIQQDRTLFMQAEKQVDRLSRARSASLVIQKQQAAWVVQYPHGPVLKEQELDRFYQLPFSRKPHRFTPDIPAYRMIRNSITIVRGCSGNCSFCAISRHQGSDVTSRSIDSILAEVHVLASQADFDGTISDLGGPTANLFRTSCSIGSCPRHDCLFPEVCKNLIIDEAGFLEMLDRVLKVPEVAHAFISSGLRLQLLTRTPRLLERIIRNHTPGNLKIAPEHTEDEVLNLMHKESHKQLLRFLSLFHAVCERLDKKTGLTPYFMSAYPGCTEAHIAAMIRKVRKLGLSIRQFQDFTPTPGTLATAMYVSGIDCDQGKPIAVARNLSERMTQRRLIEKAFLTRKPTSHSLEKHRSRIKKKKKL